MTDFLFGPKQLLRLWLAAGSGLLLAACAAPPSDVTQPERHWAHFFVGGREVTYQRQTGQGDACSRPAVRRLKSTRTACIRLSRPMCNISFRPDNAASCRC